MSDFTSKDLIYLVSQPRAGSTMLQRILAGQAQIYTTAEPWLMLHPVYALRSEGHTAEYNAQLAQEALQDFYSALPEGQEHYLESIRRMAYYLYGTATVEAGKRIFLDKTPRYYLILPDLARIMPEARFVLLYRNPLAVLNSMLELYVRERWLLLARLRDDLLLAPRLLTEAQALLGDRALVVHYEAVVSDPPGQIEAICDWLGLAYDAEMLVYGRQPAPTGTMGDPAVVNKREGPTEESLEKWLRLARQPQTRHLAQSYLDALGPQLLAAMGYDYERLAGQLAAQPVDDGEVEVTWSQLFEPDVEFEKRIQYAELALLLERRFILWVKRALGRR